MIIGLLATRATLADKLNRKLLLYVATVARHDANESLDLPWLRVTIMALISLVQVFTILFYFILFVSKREEKKRTYKKVLHIIYHINACLESDRKLIEQLTHLLSKFR
jgi:heme/copper-type cytochrome/quinol oxidase subunit 2